MTDMTKAVALMEAVLETEAGVLRSGDFASLQALERRKVEAWSLLQSARSQSNTQALAHLRDMANRNAKLLLAARDGIKSATEMRARLNAGPKPLSTYGADGRKSALSTSYEISKNSKVF